MTWAKLPHLSDLHFSSVIKWGQQEYRASLRVVLKTDRALLCAGRFPSLPPLPQQPWCSFTAHPTPSNPFPDPHPSSCPLWRLSGSPSSESKLSRSPCRTIRPAVSEHPGWPGGLDFSRAAGAGGCPGQRRAGRRTEQRSPASRGLLRPGPEKTRTGSRQATEAEEGL